jgi:GH15 family glucan-1,4-alpha-glucosidase
MLQHYLQQHTRLSEHYLPIEDYGIIGDLHTVALVGKNGAVDWCCLPRFDAPSVFATLLDSEKGGFFRVSPLDYSPEIHYSQYYLSDTNILVTNFSTGDSEAELVDFMPIQHKDETHHQPSLYRAVHVKRGGLTLNMVCSPAFNYARDGHTVNRSSNRVLFQSETLSLVLTSSIPLQEDEQGGIHATFTLEAGQSAYFLLESLEETTNHTLSSVETLSQRYQDAFLHTHWYWQHWLSQSQYEGRWREMVHRSALTLKLLTYAPTGAIVAAPTTSLPEMIGEERNWDYRYTWLRDAALTLNSLLLLGFTEEAEAFFNWFEARCHESSANEALQPMYTITGESTLTEMTLAHLEGYKQSNPVRIGNGAYTQVQLDVYGEFMDMLFTFSQHKKISRSLWQTVCHLLEWLSEHWQDNDEGIWEVRGGARPFVHSRTMCWVAFDRAIRIASRQGLPASYQKWGSIRAQIYEEIITYGWNEQVNSFVQYYSSEAIDASVLQMILAKFLSPTDPRFLSTIEHIQVELRVNHRIYRYHPQFAANDGFGSTEGTFSMCGFWLVEALAEAGHLDKARQILEQMLMDANHVGLYAEEMGACGEALGNFPQAFSHLSLITACYRLDQAYETIPLPIEAPTSTFEMAC